MFSSKKAGNGRGVEQLVVTKTNPLENDVSDDMGVSEHVGEDQCLKNQVVRKSQGRSLVHHAAYKNKKTAKSPGGSIARSKPASGLS